MFFSNTTVMPGKLELHRGKNAYYMAATAKADKSSVYATCA